MSNVTVREIASITATVFGVPREEITTAKRNASARITWAAIARRCFAAMAKRHTTTSWYQIAAAMGLRDKGSAYKRVADGATQFELDCEKSETLRELVDRIENKIDELHEARMANVNGLERPVVRAPTTKVSFN